MVTQSLEHKITSIEPVFEDTTLGGHFAVTFDVDSTFKLSFVSFIKHRFEKDSKLKEYVRNAENKEISASAIVQDLYEIGCPVEQWVEEHFEDARANLPTQFDALIQLYLYLKQFNNDQPGQD
jgi:hypothetical protein